jgi:hypothetical protein
MREDEPKEAAGRADVSIGLAMGARQLAGPEGTQASSLGPVMEQEAPPERTPG